MTKPGPKEVTAITNTAGVPVDAEAAARIANSLGPAFDGFAAVAGPSPFDPAPPSSLLVQDAAAPR